MSMIKRLLLVLFTVLVLMIIIIFINTIRFKSVQPAFTSTTAITVPDSIIRHFQEGIRFKTISYDEVPPDSAAFGRFHQYLEKTYPLIYSKLLKTVVAKYTLIFTWPGKDTLNKPVILMAHQDVVPIEKNALAQWGGDPFSGVIKNGRVWGRGSADDKISLFGILEAAERLLGEGYQPEHTVYFVFGHDEEAGGTGASAASRFFTANAIKADWILDEGGEITLKEINGLKGIPVALIGTAEKGYLSVNLDVSITGGHSSMPKAETAIDVLLKAMQNIRNKPFKAEFTQSTNGTFNYLGPEMPFGQKLIIANRWLFKNFLFTFYEKTPSGNAIIRTTIAPTIIQAGIKDNVVPTTAHAVVNFRILPGTTTNDVMKHVNSSIADKRVKISRLEDMYSEASHVTSDTSAGFLKLAQTIRSNYPGSIIAPLLSVGATDSRKLENISSSVLRFSPVTDIQGMHGLNESVGVEEYKKAINFYYQLLKR